MIKEVFDYLSYKAYLKDFIAEKPGKGHGFKTIIAQALQCKGAFVSQVLNKDANFSLEQGEALNRLLQHPPESADFFLLLVQYERAGTLHLRERLRRQIDKYIQKRQILKERVDIKETLPIEAQATYYSHWAYGVIHMLLTVEAFKTRDAIVGYTRLPIEKVSDVLDFFVRTGLAIYKNGKYELGTSRLFLGNDSPLIAKHHTNWRLQAIQSLDRDLKNDLHYSSVVSIASSEVAKVKEALIKGMQSAREIVKNSPPEEEIFCICVDFFKT